MAKKYFQYENTRNHNLDKYSILKEWSAIEAAVKFDRGKLSRDIKQWKYQNNKENLYHKSKKIKLNLRQVSLFDWTISIAYKNENLNEVPQIICSYL